jgi:hypothetical protein
VQKLSQQARVAKEGSCKIRKLQFIAAATAAACADVCCDEWLCLDQLSCMRSLAVPSFHCLPKSPPDHALRLLRC